MYTFIGGNMHRTQEEKCQFDKVPIITEEECEK